MDIICVDKSANDRVELQRHLDQAFEHSRHSMGYVSPITVTPLSLHEALVASTPELFIIGAGFNCEESIQLCRRLHHAHKDATTVALVNPKDISLRLLRRFEAVHTEVLTADDAIARFVYKLLSLSAKTTAKGIGQLITFVGAKGGVGTTTVTTGIAHAITALGGSVAILDLSRYSKLSQYLLATHHENPSFASLLRERLSVSAIQARELLHLTPGGLHLLLPPAHSGSARDTWIRSELTFEVTLEVIDHLLDQFDAVLVDMDHSEGLLPFALLARASKRILVTSNDPAAVHLLSHKLPELCATPGGGECSIFYNHTLQRGIHENYARELFQLRNSHLYAPVPMLSIPHDKRGAKWIGTGNTFYTEGSPALQHQLQEAASALMHHANGSQGRPHENTPLERLLRWWRPRTALPEPPRALPAPREHEPVSLSNRFGLGIQPREQSQTRVGTVQDDESMVADQDPFYRQARIVDGAPSNRSEHTLRIGAEVLERFAPTSSQRDQATSLFEDRRTTLI